MSVGNCIYVLPSRAATRNLKYSCFSCCKEVKTNQNAVLCVSCKRWAHLVCARATRETVIPDTNWTCVSCQFDELPTNACIDIGIDTEFGLPNQSGSGKYNYHSIDDIFTKVNSFSGIIMAHLNICSLLKNIDKVRNMLCKQNIKILCLCETKLDSSVSNSEIDVEGFRAIRTDRNRNGGGILIYIKENILFNIKHDLTLECLELMCVEICIQKQKPFLIVYWYIPPNSQCAVFDLLDSVLYPYIIIV